MSSPPTHHIQYGHHPPGTSAPSYVKDRPMTAEVMFHQRSASAARDLQSAAQQLTRAIPPASPVVGDEGGPHARAPLSPHRALRDYAGSTRLSPTTRDSPVHYQPSSNVQALPVTPGSTIAADGSVRSPARGSAADRPASYRAERSPGGHTSPEATMRGGACPDCARLRVEVDDLRNVVHSLESTVASLTLSVRTLANRNASVQRADADALLADFHSPSAAPMSPPPAAAAHTSSTPSSPPPRDVYEAELQRSEAMRQHAHAVEQQQAQKHFAAQSPMLRDQQHLVAVKAELRVFEKRMVGAMTKLANRLAAVEGDAATLLTSSEQLHGHVASSLGELKSDKVSRSELKPLVLPIIDTARDMTAERVTNIYELFGWPEARVQQAVASRDPDRVTDTIFASPSLARLVDGLVRTANDIASVRDELRHLHHVRNVEGPVLAPNQRMLGLAVGDEIDLKGVRVTQVFAGGPGHIAGFRVGDVIKTVNHVHVTCKADFLRVMSGVMPNAVVRIGRVPRGRSVVEEVEAVATTDPISNTAAPLYQSP